MDKTVSLFNFPESLCTGKSKCLCVSPYLTHLNIVTEENKSCLYELSRIEGPTLVHERSNAALRCLFCEDEKYILLLSEPDQVEILAYNNGTVLLYQAKLSEILKFSKQNTKDSTDEDVFIPLKFSRMYVVILANYQWLFVLRFTAENTLLLTNSFEVTNCVNAAASSQNVYLLSENGNILAYSLSEGVQIGVGNLYSMPFTHAIKTEDKFYYINVSKNDSYFAAVTESGKIFVGNSQEYFCSENKGSSESVMSASSFTSLVSTRTTSSLLKPQQTVLDSSFPYPSESKNQKIESYKSLWSSHISSLKKKVNKTKNSCSIASFTTIEDDTRRLMLKEIQVTSSHIHVWYVERNSETGGKYRLYNPSTGDISSEYDLPSEAVIIKSHIYIFLCPNSLNLYLGGCTRENLVTKVLYCMDTSAVARLFQGDDFGNLIVAVPVLNDGLRHKQLDIVKYALCIHSESFKYSLSSMRQNQYSLEEKNNKIAADLHNLFSSAINALEECDNFSCFHQQLLSQVLEHASEILELYSNMSIEADIVNLNEMIMEYITKLRSYLFHNDAEKGLTSTQLYQPLSQLSDILKRKWIKWQSLEDKFIVHDAILKNCIPAAQTFLITCRGWDTCDIFDRLKLETSSFALKLLEELRIREAIEVYTNMDIDAERELHSVFLNTLNSNIRDILAEYMCNSYRIDKNMLDALNFIQKLEHTTKEYTCENTGFMSEIYTRYHIQLALDEPSTIPSIEKKLPLFSVILQPQEWRDNVINEIYFNTYDENVLREVQPMNAWEYLLQHNSWTHIVSWIECFYGQKTMRACKIYDWSITQCMVDTVTNTNTNFSKYLCNSAVDYLSRYGIFSSNEKRNICLVLTRLSRTKFLRNIKNIMNYWCYHVTTKDFINLFSEFCVKHNLFNILFPCLIDYDFQEIQNIPPHLSSTWFSIWLVFKNLKLNILDERIWCDAFVASCSCLNYNNMKQFLEENSVVFVASIFYQYGSLIPAAYIKQPMVTSSMIKNAAEIFPLLNLIYLSDFMHEKHPDIAHYRFVKESSRFDIMKLFTWQKLHLNSSEEIPYFSQGKLVQKYGHKDSLGYLHYLKQERPCFAANLLFIEAVKQDGKMFKKINHGAISLACGLALKNHACSRMTASCIAFVEILGTCSQNLRLLVKVLNVVAEYLTVSQNDSERTCYLIHGLALNREDNAYRLLTHLESALLTNMHNLEDNIACILCYWHTAVKFCKAHSICLPEEFLKNCGSGNRWLEFVLFLECFQYPVFQALKLVSEFITESLYEHMFHAVTFCGSKPVEQVDTENITGLSNTGDDFRKSLYSKITLHSETCKRPSVDIVDDTSNSPSESSISQLSSSSSDSLSLKSSSLYLDSETNVPSFLCYGNLFLTLLQCNNSLDPPHGLLSACYEDHNPLFSLFSFSYEPSSALSCLCTWLEIGLQKPHPLSFWWCIEDLEDLMADSVANGLIVHLARGWKIFMNENPLGPFFDFLVNSVVLKQFKDSIIYMKSFKAACLNLRHNIHIDTTMEDIEASYIMNEKWNVRVAIRLINVVISSCFLSSSYIKLFLQVLDDCFFQEYVQMRIPDYHHLFLIADCLSETGVDINWSAILMENESYRDKSGSREVLNLLLDQKMFSIALSFAKLEKFLIDSVILLQWLDNLTLFLKTDKVAPCFDVEGFISECYIKSREFSIDSQKIAEFFKHCADNVSCIKLKYKMLQAAVSCLKDDSDEMKTLRESLELCMWKCYLLSDEIQYADSKETFYMRSLDSNNLLEQSKTSVNVSLLNEMEKMKVNKLINHLLDNEDIISAFHIGGLFNCITKDMELLLTCLQLAEERLKPHELNIENKRLLAVPKNISRSSYRHRTIHSERHSSISSSRSEISLHSSLCCDIIEEQQDLLPVLESLVEHVVHGTLIGYKITHCFHAATLLNKSFKDILKLEDPLSLLKSEFSNYETNGFAVASDLLLTGMISNEKLTTFLCDEILLQIREKDFRPGCDLLNKQCTIWGRDLNSEFHLILELCEDPSVLADKLLSEICNITHMDFNNIQQAVEILIYAHSCFTAACNIEGIVEVLYKAQNLSKLLLHHEQWTVLVRLFTGIGRYTEMSYVFHMLKDHGQFDILCGKEMENKRGLKSSALEYLEKYHPEDKNLWRITALHFKLFGEVGNQLVKEATIRLKKICSRIVNTNENRELLQASIMDFSQAAEYFVQANKLNEALTIAHQGELVSLQLSLLNAVPTGHKTDSVLNLNSQAVSDIITHKLSFPQACIIARAYSHPVDWGGALYQHCIVDKDSNYLFDFTHNMQLTSDLIEDVARRFQRETNITKTMTIQMKKFVSCISDVLMKYQMASKLGFKDVIEGLFSTSALPYLKDTVWKSGYKNY